MALWRYPPRKQKLSTFKLIGPLFIWLMVAVMFGMFVIKAQSLARHDYRLYLQAH